MAIAENIFANKLRCILEYLGLGNFIAPFPIRRQSRPWQVNELPVVKAPGMITAAPDYVGVGTQKSGTSWWASLLEQHPQISNNLYHRKEMHYLSHFLEQPMTEEDIATYHAVFTRPSGQLCGEWTPNYLANPYTIIRLNQAAPDARILVMVRNPIYRYESGFNHEYKVRFGAMIAPKIRNNVIRKYALRTESIWYGMYGTQMDILKKHVDSNRILLLQYEACKAEPQKYIRETYRFLGVNEDYMPEGIDKKVNVKRRKFTPISEETKQLLKDIYTEDVKNLTEKFPESINPDLWPEFANN